MKRFIALVLSLVMALSLCAPAWGAEDTTVAKVGDVEYTSLQKAIDAAAENGDTVKLLDDLSVNDVNHNYQDTFYSAAFIPSGAIDGAGKNLTMNLAGDLSNTFGIWSWGDITGIKNLTLNSNTRSALLVETNTVDCVIENVTVTAAGNAIHMESSKNIVLRNNTFTTTDDDGFNWSAAVFAGYGANVTIESGTYTGEKAIYTGGNPNFATITITGGTFNGNIVVQNNDKLIIKGGTFSVDPTQWMDEDSTITKNNDGTWTVIPDPVEVAQKALDNATVGTVIQLEADVDYGTLYFRANPGHSNTTLEDIADAWAYNYNRSIEDVTILGATGATVDGIIFETGALSGDRNNRVTVKNLVIDGVEFTDKFTASSAGYNAPVMITTSNATIDGLTVKNCKLVGDNDKLNLVYLYGADGSKNVTLTGNTVEGIARLCELRGTENVTITSNTIKNTYEHAMLLAGAGYSGNVTITGNTAEGNNARFLRMSGAAAASVVIEKNTITNYKGSDADIMKITDATGAVSITGNTVPTGKTATLDSVKGIVDITTNASCKIIGGTFTEKPADSYVANGYEATEKDGKWVVAEEVVEEDPDIPDKEDKPVVVPAPEETNAVVSENAAALKDKIAEIEASDSTDPTVSVKDTTTGETVTVEFNDAAAMIEFTTATETDVAIATSKMDDATVEDAEKDKIEAEVKNELGNDAKVVGYVDVDLHLFANEIHVGNITELPENEAVTVPIPASVLSFFDFGAVPENHTRHYYVIRYHGDKAEKLDAEMINGTLYFESHLFSTYAVVYEDVPNYSWGGYYPIVGGTTSSTDKPVVSADTFDAGIGMYVAMSVMAAAGSAVVMGKKRED